MVARDGVEMEEEPMHLMLEAQEHEVLLWAAKGAISDLGTEIGHTDNHAMRKDLQKRKEIFSGFMLDLDMQRKYIGPSMHERTYLQRGCIQFLEFRRSGAMVPRSSEGGSRV